VLRTGGGVRNISAALVAAAFVPILVFLAVQAGSYAIHYAFFFPTSFSWSRARDDLWQFLALAPYIFIVATGHALALGLPVFLWLRRRGKANGWTSALAGFVIGCLPMSVFGFPSRSQINYSYSANMWGRLRELVVEGAPTLWGWVSYAESLATFGACGAAAGLAFWLAWHHADQPSSSD